MSKENRRERGQKAADREKFALEMKQITCSLCPLGKGWVAMVLNCSKESLSQSLSKLSKYRLALPGEVVESPSVEDFKSRLNKHIP